VTVDEKSERQKPANPKLPVMMESKTHKRVVRNRKKIATPLSKLRTSEVVKTIVDHPRRLEELLRMLEDKDLGVRGRAAATLAKLSESHPARLLRAIAQIKESLNDDSAYVRWHLSYVLGKLGSQFPALFPDLLKDLVNHLEDTNRIVRIIACKALGQVAARKPAIVEDFFRDLKKEIPPAVARFLGKTKAKFHNI
jgi:HEAT repeat protein